MSDFQSKYVLFFISMQFRVIIFLHQFYYGPVFIVDEKVLFDKSGNSTAVKQRRLAVFNLLYLLILSITYIFSYVKNILLVILI